jgi:hypothetical protein
MNFMRAHMNLPLTAVIYLGDICFFIIEPLNFK